MVCSFVNLYADFRKQVGQKQIDTVCSEGSMQDLPGWLKRSKTDLSILLVSLSLIGLETLDNGTSERLGPISSLCCMNLKLGHPSWKSCLRKPEEGLSILNGRLRIMGGPESVETDFWIESENTFEYRIAVPRYDGGIESLGVVQEYRSASC